MLGDQRGADKIEPKETPGHVPRNHAQQELRRGKMFGSKNRQRDGVANVVQSNNFLDAACAGKIFCRGQKADRQHRQARDEHPESGTGKAQEDSENGWRHYGGRSARNRLRTRAIISPRGEFGTRADARSGSDRLAA
jgi:hypothetical protein